MRKSLGLVAAGVMAAGIFGLSGCSGWPFVQSQACVDWVAWDTPAEAEQDAAATVRGTVGEQAGTTDLYGYTVNVWTVHVDEWLKGSGGSSIRVVSTPETCSDGSPYPEGDIFEKAAGTSVIFLSDYDGGWQGVTPWQAIVPATPDGGIPDAWPAGTMGSPPATPPAE